MGQSQSADQPEAYDMNRRRGSDHTVLIGLFGLFLFHSPLNIWWANLALPWYVIFVPWLLIIVLVAWNQTGSSGGN